MRKEQISDKEAICTVTLFIMGSTMILGIGGEAKQDAWLVGVAGMLMSLPMIFIYCRIQALWIGKDLFEILESTFGKIMGRVITFIYIWYALHLGAMILRNFGEFINVVAMPETPMFVILAALGILTIIAVRLGIEEIGRFSAYLLPILIIIIIVVNVLSLKEWNISFLKPVMENGPGPILKGGFSVFSFPFAETVLLLGIMFSVKTTESPYKVYYFSVFFAGSIIIFFTIRNTAILGTMASMLYFPSHIAVSRVNIMDFLQRIEVTVAVVFVIGVFVKSSVCLFTACKGLARMFNLKDYRSIVIQFGILMIVFSYTIYDNIMEMRYWAFKVYQYYAFPMQVILPILLWVFVEIKYRKSKSKKSGKGA